MAEEPRSNQSIDEIKAKVARSRERLERDVRGLRYELDFPRKIRRSFEKQTVVWITAAVVVGTLVVLLPMRKRKVVYVNARGKGKSGGKAPILEAGFLLGALKIAATLLKPTITSFVARKLAGVVAGAGSTKKW